MRVVFRSQYPSGWNRPLYRGWLHILGTVLWIWGATIGVARYVIWNVFFVSWAAVPQCLYHIQWQILTLHFFKGIGICT